MQRETYLNNMNTALQDDAATPPPPPPRINQYICNAHPSWSGDNKQSTIPIKDII